MFKYSLYGQLLYLSKSTPSVTKVHLFVILIFRYIYSYLTDVIFSIFTFSLQIYCIFILAYFTSFCLSCIGTFSQQELNYGARINHEPDWNDIMINIQSWGGRDGCFLDSQLDPHTGECSQRLVLRNELAQSRASIYTSSDLTQKMYVMAPPLHGLRLTSLFPLRVL